MTQVKFLRKRELRGRLYAQGVAVMLEDDALADKLARVGDVAIISRDIVLQPLSVSQTAGNSKV